VQDGPNSRGPVTVVD